MSIAQTLKSEKMAVCYATSYNVSQVYELLENCCRVLVPLSLVVLACGVPGVIRRQAATDGWFSMWQSALHLLLLGPCHG